MFGRKKRELRVDNNIISVKKIDNEDYLSITDMIKSKDGDFFVSDWLRNRYIIQILIMANSP